MLIEGVVVPRRLAQGLLELAATGRDQLMNRGRRVSDAMNGLLGELAAAASAERADHFPVASPSASPSFPGPIVAGVSTKTAAAMLDRSPRAVRYMIDRKELRAEKQPNGHYLVEVPES
jgi:hypothetical protein